MLCTWCILYIYRQIEVLEDSIEQGQCTLDIHLYRKQLPNWEEEPALEGGEGNDATKADAGMQRIVNNLQPRNQVYNGRRNREECSDEHEEPAPNHLLAYLQISKVLVLFLELFLCQLLPTKGLHQQDTTDRERLLHHSRQRGQTLLCVLTGRSAHIPDLVGDPQEDRQQPEGDQCEERAEIGHRDNRAQSG